MTLEIAQIRAGIAANLMAALSDSRQISAYREKNPMAPALMVTGFGELLKVGMGSWQMEFLVQGLAGAPTEKSAQIRLDKWISPLGATSVWKAIESDKTLGGIVNNAIVTKCDGAQFIEAKPGVELLGSTWHVQIEL